MLRKSEKIIWGFFCAVLSAAAVLSLLGLSPVSCMARGSENVQAAPEESGIVQAAPEKSGIVQAAPESGETEELDLYSTAAVLMDADSGRILYGKNQDQVLAMASTTKIMTCILILETVSLDDVLTVSSYAAGMPKVKLYVRQGEEYTVRDLLYSMMLESHNDAAAALAEYAGKQYLSEELKNKPTEEFTAGESGEAVGAFARKMNEKAAELGCENTWFITPNGLDATEEFTLSDGTVVTKEHSTTAAELARILAYCIKESPEKDLFLKITQTESYSFYANGRSFSLSNHNAFLNMMEGALSGKTGFTGKAGYCYVGALEREGRTFVVALLACGWPNNKTWKWSDTEELMQYGIDNYFYRSFAEQDTAFDESLLTPLPVENGQTKWLGEVSCVPVELEASAQNADSAQGEALQKEGLLLREEEKVCVEYFVRESLEAPVESGTEVGSVEYSVDGVVYRRERIVTAGAVGKKDYSWCLQKVLARFLIK